MLPAWQHLLHTKRPVLHRGRLALLGQLSVPAPESPENNKKTSAVIRARPPQSAASSSLRSLQFSGRIRTGQRIAPVSRGTRSTAGRAPFFRRDWPPSWIRNRSRSARSDWTCRRDRFPIAMSSEGVPCSSRQPNSRSDQNSLAWCDYAPWICRAPARKSLRRSGKSSSATVTDSP